MYMFTRRGIELCIALPEQRSRCFFLEAAIICAERRKARKILSLYVTRNKLVINCNQMIVKKKNES